MAKVRSIALTTVQVRELVDSLDGVVIPRNTLDRWVTSGLLAPTVRAGRAGKGHHRLYSRGDAARLRMIARLHYREGMSIQQIRLVFARLDGDPQLRDELLNANTRAELIVDRFRAVIVRPGGNAVEVLTGQVRLPLRDVVEGIEQTAKRLIA